MSGLPRRIFRGVTALRIGQKMAVVVALVALPLTLVLSFYMQQVGKDVAFTRAEIDGLSRLDTVWTTMLQVADDEPDWHARARRSWQPGSGSGKLGVPAAAAIEQFARSLEAEASRSRVLALGRTAVRRIADGANLTLDPDLDSYYLVELLVAHAPDLVASAGDMHEVIGASAQRKAGMPEYGRLRAALARFDDAEARIRGAIAAAQEGNAGGDLARSLRAPAEVYATSVRSLRDLLALQVQRMEVGQETASLASAYEAADTAMLRQVASLWSAARSELGRILAVRLDALENDRRNNLSLTAICLLLCFLAMGLVVRSIREPVSDMVTAIRHFQQGEPTAEIRHSEGAHEVGEVARALNHLVATESDTRREIASIVSAAAGGDFSRRIGVEGKTGFVRDVATGLNDLAAMVESTARELAGAMDAVARGDLTITMASRHGGQFGKLQQSIEVTIQRLCGTLATIQSAAGDATAAAREIKSGASDLSQRTEEQAASLEEIAATTEQLAASVKASASSSHQAVEQAGKAMTAARSGGDIVSEAILAMERIEAASRRIWDISSVINHIASQTNLLALNAAVEAARAGTSGRGFAVVASEVRSLAQRSADAARDISELIGASGREVAQGVRLVRSAGEALSEILEASSMVSTTVMDISTASAEQASGIDEISHALSHMDEITQQNAALAEQSAASAVTLAEQIERLNELVKAFRTRPGRGEDMAIPVAPPPRPPRLPAVAAVSAPEKLSPGALRQLARDAFAPPQRPQPPRARSVGAGWEEF